MTWEELTRDLLHPSEWDFRRVAASLEQHQVEELAHYEYCRENSDLARLFDEWKDTEIDWGEERNGRFYFREDEDGKIPTIAVRHALGKGLGHLSDNAAMLVREAMPPLDILTEHLFEFLLNYPDFPKPWACSTIHWPKQKTKRRLPPVYIERRVQKPGFQRAEAYTPWEPPGRLGSDREECRMFIDWSKHPTVLKRSFEDWLRKNRPATVKPKETRGQKVTYQRLKWLAAYRLQKAGIRFKEAQRELFAYRNANPVEASHKNDQVFPYYTTQGAWDSAIKKAQSLISKIYFQKKLY